MSDTPTKRTPAKKAPSGEPKENQAPAFLQGIKPQDPTKLLAEATPEQRAVLMGAKDGGFALWAQYAGIEVDNHKFDFDAHRYLLPIYLDNHQEVVLIKAAQMGATVYQLLFLIWWARYHNVKCGMYFPTADGVAKLSKDRFGPLLESNKEIRSWVRNDVDTLGLKQISNAFDRTSSIYLMYLGGQATKDSVPLDVVVFDEVRLVNEADIDQALERISHSNYKIKRFMSTAGFPLQDIHKRYLRGTQHVWHIRCACLEGFVPSEVFPECIADTGKEVYLRCPRCQMRIHDPQIGAYVSRNPKADVHSYSVSQLISKFITPKEIWNSFLTTTNKKEFYNAKLGMPYIDTDNQPVTLEVLENCVNPEIHWFRQPGFQHRSSPCAMGVDQMGGYNYVVIANRNKDGKKTLVHLEIIESSNPEYYEDGKPITPFKRLYALMREFNVTICVCDAMPNYNEAADFARAFPGRVFLAHYGDMGVDIVKWHDKLKMKEQIKRGSKEIKLKWQVTINRYMGIDYCLQEFAERNIDIPHPDALVQTVRNIETGRFEVEPICRTRFFPQVSSLVRQAKELGTEDEPTGRVKMQWVETAGDPHYLHAMTYCAIALERMKRMSQFIMV